ncbi:hypothetical protein Purlil1_12535 [Purpureocillium lilacinum]|uniref:Uncharacterized protein n=1 Tax=Purpureocillium lilacinum TaxID=33203 RepID=A0ABR0BGN6_PURLI|nr:hypothetical protein Purlil1_12535 [Purpureocillium lilacinum]
MTPPPRQATVPPPACVWGGLDRTCASFGRGTRNALLVTTGARYKERPQRWSLETITWLKSSPSPGIRPPDGGKGQESWKYAIWLMMYDTYKRVAISARKGSRRKVQLRFDGGSGHGKAAAVVEESELASVGRAMTTGPTGLSPTDASRGWAMASTRLYDEDVDGELSPLSQEHSRDETHAGISWDFFNDTQQFESLDGNSNTADVGFLQLCEEAFSITAKRQVISVGGDTYALTGNDGACVDLTEPLMDILVISGQAYRVVDPAGDCDIMIAKFTSITDVQRYFGPVLSNLAQPLGSSATKMANEVKNYFLSPSWDYAPDGKPGVTIALWNIVSSPTNMVPPLAAASTVPTDNQTGETSKHSFEWIREHDKEKKFGVWTKFLSTILGLGIDIGHKRKTSIHDLYTFKAMVTKEAFPTDGYLEKMAQEGAVRKYLERFDFKKPVYIVVGTKSVSGTNVKQIRKKEGSIDSALSADLMQRGAPVSLGPEFVVSNNNHDTIGFKGSSDFVFAFRIRKILVTREFRIRDQDDVEGGALGEYYDQPEEKPVIKGLEGSDSKGANFAGSQEEMVEDDEEQVCVTVLGDAL